MAIVAVDPANWQELSVNVVQVDSDAIDNRTAMMEINQWAATTDFARTTEYWLRQIIRRDGKRVFRGICYRLTKEEQESSVARMNRVDEIAQRISISASIATDDD